MQLPAILTGLQACLLNLPNCNTVARGVLNSLLPDNAPALLNGRLTVAVAQLDAFSASLAGSATWTISSWTSKEDLIDTLIASATIPCYNLPGTYATLRGQPVRTHSLRGEKIMLQYCDGAPLLPAAPARRPSTADLRPALTRSFRTTPTP